MNWHLNFLGVGAAHAAELGSSAAVLERDGVPLLLIDCGPDTLDRYMATYDALPSAIFITHTHMDHVAGLERLFIKLWFDEHLRGNTRLFLHAGLMPWLQARVADYPGVLAEGGVNFWEAFRLIPCTRGFWLDGLWFDVFATRHHVPGTSYGLALDDCFAYTGDTRPIPEVLTRHAGGAALIAHDCSLVGNPSHTGIDDIEREYPRALRRQMILYHYGSAADGEALAARGYRVAATGERVALAPPSASRADAG
ncbi:MBL fold metallo-hydrolase [Rhodanobacter spathiphylli]|uniref:Beta-lactamase superfamily metal-dependent hydrolase n=1 Tax=Rhodanobacter spathiphylli B39 TaxID=1163407 RepID=I4W6F7_9GAMM|nr:MBL fold metallo-hydrolase [Rhodanobacter spathiphylli]EIL95048.1 beta-lactamase superfamily metal-dependent hydrolase [Rhodanobacter spathiphylli B39]